MELKVEIVQGNDVDPKYTDKLNFIAEDAIQELYDFMLHDHTGKKHMRSAFKFDIDGKLFYCVANIERSTLKAIVDFRHTDTNFKSCANQLLLKE
jgi:hypothetical protein